MDNLSLLQQLIARWKASSPTFFKVITNISLILSIISGIPMLLSLFPEIHLPAVFLGWVDKAVFVAGVVASVISKLTVATPAATSKVLTEVSTGTDPQTAKAKAS